ncbi:DUF3958 family protein [Enterococcus sp. LJL128]|uniref:DUF3958 family protein n=1 Tax=Enterococcus sp. LJL51 TaxID=3416656 RepID=UPI003CF69306
MAEKEQWEELARAERQLVYEKEELEDKKRSIDRLDEAYQEHFFQTAALFQSAYDLIAGEKEDQYLVEECAEQIQRKQRNLSEMMEEEQENIAKEHYSLNEKEDELFYQKKRWMTEKEEESR